MIVPEQIDLPGWVPKNYIEKGLCLIILTLTPAPMIKRQNFLI